MVGKYTGICMQVCMYGHVCTCVCMYMQHVYHMLIALLVLPSKGVVSSPATATIDLYHQASNHSISLFLRATLSPLPLSLPVSVCLCLFLRLYLRLSLSVSLSLTHFLLISPP